MAVEKWKLSKDNFGSVLGTVLPVPSRSGVTSSEYIKIENVKQGKVKFSMASEVSAEAFAEGIGVAPFADPVYLDRRMLEPFYSQGKDLGPEYYEFVVNDKTVTIVHGKRRGVFKSYTKAEGYTAHPKMEGAIHFPVKEQWANLLECAAMCALDDFIVPALNCIYMETDKDGNFIMLSTDDKIAFMGVLPNWKSVLDSPLIFPLRLSDMAKVENDGVVYFSPKYVMLQFQTGRIWQGVRSEAKKGFPAKRVKEIVANGKAGKFLFSLGAESIAASAARIASYMAAVTREDIVLKMVVREGKSFMHLLVSAAGSDFDEVVKLSNPSEREVEISWPLKVVIPLLMYAKRLGELRVYQLDTGDTCFTAGNIAIVLSAQAKKK